MKRDEYTFEPVQAATLKEQVASRIRTAILQGDLEPGARIVESRLADQVNVAQTTVREALQELENQGFVVKFVNRETRVRRLEVQDLVNLFHLRADLEGLAVELAHPRADSRALAPLYRIVDAMRYAAARDDMAQFYQHDMQFHQQLWRLAGNEFLERALAPLSLGPVAFVLAGAKAPLKGDYVQVACDHADILDVFREVEPKAARRLMEEKLRLWHEMQMRKVYGENLP